MDCSIQKQVAITSAMIKETLQSPEDLKKYLGEFRSKLVELRASGGSMTEMEAYTILLGNLPQYFQPFAFGYQAVLPNARSLDDLCAQLERLPPPLKSLGLTTKPVSPTWKSVCTKKPMTCFKCNFSVP